jgi:hypothetical protein
MTKQLSARAQKALALLNEGALFRYRLERDSYTGRDQFKTALVMNGKKVRGYGFKTFDELRSMLSVYNSTSVSTYYQLHKES